MHILNEVSHQTSKNTVQVLSANPSQTEGSKKNGMGVAKRMPPLPNCGDLEAISTRPKSNRKPYAHAPNDSLFLRAFFADEAAVARISRRLMVSRLREAERFDASLSLSMRTKLEHNRCRYDEYKVRSSNPIGAGTMSTKLEFQTQLVPV